MHLRTLTLRGFKSFASATTLSFEPGITCVVGPNGSGKSNVVDALAWVMGEQGAKSLRGAAMADVIFAGTSGRPPLGRAEVSLTIDNTDGALPIDYAEVTITRTLFRSGGSEYAINGSQCRLLDVQDLLSDSGIGREMHVIVGQGQLEAVLRATPEERRGFVEEAAGVLKHRKRKEKALRKLDAMQVNLQRLADLTAEVRRQLGPLGRQAEVARRAATIQSDVRDARARLLADDLAQVTAQLAQDAADEAAVRAEHQRVEAELTAAGLRLAEAEADAAHRATAVDEAADAWYRACAVRERLRGIRALAAERTRLLSSPEVESRGQDPEELEAQAARAQAAEAELEEEVALARDGLADALAWREEAEEVAREAEQAVAGLLRAVADRREGLARLAGQVGAQRSRVESAEAEIGRLRHALAEAERRGGAATTEFALVEAQVRGVEQGELDLDAEFESAQEEFAASTQQVADVVEAERTAQGERATWHARIEALELSLDRKDGAGALLAAGLPGTDGSLAALLAIEAGYEDAVAAAFGAVADAIVVEGPGPAVDALRHLREQDAGRASLVVATAVDVEPAEPAPEGGIWVRDVVQPAERIAGVVAHLLSGIVVVEDLARARRLVLAHPRLVAVTRTGDLLGAYRAWGGSASAPSVLHLQSALDEARTQHEEATVRAEQSHNALRGAREALDAALSRRDAALDRLHESDAAMAGVAEQLGQLGALARAAAAEADRHRTALAAAEEALEIDDERLIELAERLDAAQSVPTDADDAEKAGVRRDEAAAAASSARGAETEARLALRTAEERARALAGRAQSLAAAAAAEREAREQAARRAAERADDAVRAAAVEQAADVAVSAADRVVEDAAVARDLAQSARAERDTQIHDHRRCVDALGARLRELTDVAHREEVARAEQRLRREQLEERAAQEIGMDPVALVEEFGPHRGIPSVEGGETAYERTAQAKRLKAAERDLARLGKVNPLALEEYAALEERHKFLADQLTDLKNSRTDLLEIVREIDDRVERVFTEAYAETAIQFERVFARMFPGGEGRLVLTDPDSMLTTGIEVEARPAGKKVKRLSLLSGGERSLTAIALLVAIFKARPSPFYVMDEVEAALDDVNLGRLLEVLRELREDSQLIVITHQKRTMEVADALYGVTMRGDGVSTVISQRLREDARAI